MRLRSWNEIREDYTEDVELNALDQFIYDWEPTGELKSKEFRLAFVKALHYIVEEEM